jgi:osmotically-inducible protein OsmY
VGFDGDEAIGVATVDVQTGEVKRYSLKDAPAWIDRIQPESFIKEQAENRGYLVNGWLNPSDKDRMTVSTIDLVYSADGHADYYVGLTSVGKPMGLIGFLLVDSRSKKVKRYVMPGAAENAATAAAEGVNPEKHYSATNPLPFMLNSTPTYAMTLRDATGIARAYALVSMRDTSKVVVADSLQAADRQYQMKLGQDRTSVQNSSSVMARKLDGLVELIGSDTRNGNTLYYLTIDSAPGRIFMGSTDVSVEIALTRQGQKVAIEYESGDTQVTSLVKFDNLDIPNLPATK